MSEHDYEAVADALVGLECACSPEAVATALRAAHAAGYRRGLEVAVKVCDRATGLWQGYAQDSVGAARASFMASAHTAADAAGDIRALIEEPGEEGP